MNIKDEEMMGKKFNRLLVVEKTKDKNGRTIWKCLCDCQADKQIDEIKWTYATTNQLRRGLVPGLKGSKKSCGCLHKEISSINGKKNKKYNKYNVDSYDYGIGWTYDGYEFYFDLEDYDLIKQYCWHKHQDGYLRTCYETIDRHNKYIMMHQLLTNTKECDHKDGNPANNRRDNLRPSNHMKNMKNLKLYKSNTSGHKGITFNKAMQKYQVYITYDKHRLHLGFFENYEDAVKVREAAEQKYFGEYNRTKENL